MAGDFLFGITNWCESQVSMFMSVLVDCALDGILRRGLGSGAVRAEGNTEVDDVSSPRVVDKTCWKQSQKSMSQSRPGTIDRLEWVGQLTVDVNWLEGSVRISTTATSGRGSAVFSLFLSDVGGPVLFHHRADDDVEHRVLDVLLDESTESGVIERGRVNLCLVLVGFAVEEDLRAM